MTLVLIYYNCRLLCWDLDL